MICYLIVGTNPRCIEIPKIENIDNPIFNHFTPFYIPGFDVENTREMVRKLGRGMGLKFDETIYGKLTEDFGGHPFLIRHVSSLINKRVLDFDRPVSIDRLLYQNAKDDFIQNYSNYLDMILGVLKEFYPDEYSMLEMLANEDYAAFNDFAEAHISYTAHLLGYGIIGKTISGYDFKIDAIKTYLSQQSRYKKIGLTVQEKWKEISERRNLAEVKLRKIIRMQLQASKGSELAKKNVLDIFGEPRKSKLSHLNYSQLFDPNESEIYFLDLAKIISKEWDIFKHIFSRSKQDNFQKLDFINQSRVDAHAKNITDDEFVYFRLCMNRIEQDLDDFI